MYNRVENLDELIRSVKLPYTAWKVLFLVNKETESNNIAGMLEIESTEVESVLDELVQKGLITLDKTVEAEAPAQEEVVEEQKVETVVEPEITSDEDTLQEATEEESGDTTSQIDELLSESVEEPALDDEIDLLEEVTDEAPVVEEKQPEPELEEASEQEIEVVEKEEAKTAEEEIEINVPGSDADDDISDKLEFEFNLTGDDEEMATPEPTPAAAAPVQEEVDKSGFKKILVIDDSLVIRKMVEIALEEEDFAIETAVSGNEGLEMLDQINPDLVILDMMLPDINGIEILKTIKASKGIPVIMLSGKDSPQMIETAKQEGASEFLPKPFKDDDLVEKIKTFI